MAFRGLQKSFHYIQTNSGSCDEVFPLLCPVREADWIEGWEYELIYSDSGLAELDCVFQTPSKEGHKTTWQITQYDREHYKLEFVRVTPGQQIVKINIALQPITANKTRTIISYRYTALNEAQNELIVHQLAAEFNESMQYWEQAINHYINTGKKLLKSQVV